MGWLVVFDLGSGVDLRHPNAHEFLKRDINNIGRFFNKRGILVEDSDKIFEDITGFYYGRLDVKFKNVESLSAGMDFNIIEINGASSESINIWDRNAGLSTAVKTLLQQYLTLFKLGNVSRKRGSTPPGLMALYRAWRFENNLVKQYPQND